MIQFSVITPFSSIWPINRTLSGATTPGQSGPDSDGNEGGLRIPQNSSITEASPSDCLVSYLDTCCGSLTPQQRCSWFILQPQTTRPESIWKLTSNIFIRLIMLSKRSVCIVQREVFSMTLGVCTQDMMACKYSFSTAALAS